MKPRTLSILRIVLATCALGLSWLLGFARA